MTLEEAFSDQLKTARKALGYTQEQVAEAVSISLRWYQMLEKYGCLPRAIILLRLQLFLHLTPEPLRPQAGLLEPGPSPRALARQRRKANAGEPEAAAAPSLEHV